MASAVISFGRRRGTAIALTALAAIAVAMVLLNYRAGEGGLSETYYLSGWILFGMCVLLGLYNLRKKLPYPPLFKSSTWLQLHIYIGLLALLVFGFHVAWRVPNGPLEITLALVFLGVALSGVLGLFLSRLGPTRLSVSGEEVIFERIPTLRRRLRDQAENLAVESVKRTDTTTLSDFYQNRLLRFFSGPRNLALHVAQSGRPLKRLLDDLRSLHRYMDDEERQMAEQLAELIEAKDGLDYHYAMQGLLKLWLFVHIPLTYVLLVLLVVHIVVVHTFVGAAS